MGRLGKVMRGPVKIEGGGGSEGSFYRVGLIFSLDTFEVGEI